MTAYAGKLDEPGRKLITQFKESICRLQKEDQSIAFANLTARGNDCSSVRGPWKCFICPPIGENTAMTAIPAHSASEVPSDATLRLRRQIS